ncbi:hypothetical protein K437DRAFT_107342 [Tilletiaria anomala UBC 951]|uniref:ER membrane protein complex subunit 10 n=1 Tax=Tilletiaria anomala (strain ATCC 24038 / CBS 436.72 / UBC 951) TaxID=1037660 RepID=A0A066W1M9_TILAU|nr:uncharacterized protein K437DRAFT_107342 [Tilletiaria anomala UBC 951]KDN46453.1 hypothetical protein K437DRAFT_107342 [Tilletiaria anomala UBC 951]
MLSPPLQQPVPVREDGTAEVPPVETSFLRKYWMFVLPIVILLILPSEAVAGGSAEHDSSSESAPNAALAARQIK